MDTSKLNQTELSYESSAGFAKVNLTNGKLLYEHLDASIGLNSNNINVSHIYNSHFELPTSLNTHMGQNWKLDIQQYLYENDDNTYTYVDSIGMNHIFENLTDDEYYDTSGMGLILKIETNKCTITDLVGNKMTFEEGKLTSIVSIVNENNTKYIDYDGNKITSICNSVVSIEFEYNKNDYLSRMNVLYYSDKLKQYLLEYIIKYVYDENNKLSYITKESKEGIEKIITMFKYENEMLEYAVSFIDNNGFKFVFDNDKVTKLITCQANIIAEQGIDKKPLLYVGDDIYVGEDNYLGETYNKTIYSLQDEINESNYLSLNSFGYNENNTDVSNEYGVTITYFFDNDKNLVSVFENDYEQGTEQNNKQKIYNMITKNIGINVPLKNDNISTECPCIINGLQIYNYKSSDDIEFSDVIVSDTDDSSQKKTYNITEGQYTFSFWLYLSTSFERKNILLEINKGDECITTATAIINPDAVGCWQQVVVSLDVVFDYFDSIKVYFKNKVKNEEENSNEENKKNESIDIYLSDIYYYLNSSNKIQLLDGINIEHLTEIDVDNVKLTDFKYMTENDLYLTFNKRNKLVIEKSTNSVTFPLYYNNASKVIMVNEAELICDETRKYTIGLETSTLFPYERITVSEGGVVTTKVNYLLQDGYIDEDISGLCYCVCKTITIKGSEDEEYYSYEFYDKYNRLILSIDPYNVHKKIIYSEDGIEQIVSGNNEVGILTSDKFDGNIETIFDGVNTYKIVYDDVTGLPLSESVNDKLVKEYSYNNYSQELQAVRLYGNILNRFINGKGKLIKLLDNNFGYKYEYDKLGRLNKVRNTSDNRLLHEWVENKESNDKTSYLIDNNGHITSSIYTKYGNLKELTNNGYTITNEYETSLNSLLNPKIVKTTITKNNIEEEKIIYNYDEKNALIGYNDIRKTNRKRDEDDIYSSVVKENSNPMNVKYSSKEVNSTLIELDDGTTGNYTLKMELDEKQQRISLHSTKVNGFSLPNNADFGIDTYYYYDGLGREKRNNIGIETLSSTDLVKERSYNNLNLFPECDIYKYSNDYIFGNFYYEYLDGKLTKITTNKDLSDEQSVTYTYDEYDRLASETKKDGTLIQYTYDDRGNVLKISVTKNNITEEYDFEYNSTNPNLLTTCSNEGYSYINIDYDGYGNLKSFTKNETSYNLTWENNKYLSSVSSGGINLSTYKYDGYGRRISKTTSDGKIREYFYEGNKLLWENIYYLKEFINLSYIYDKNGITGFVYNKSVDSKLVDFQTYYYLKDALGNINAITDGESIIARYDYDAWGNHTVNGTNKEIGDLNPFRYRGYYYDVETGWFWLSSRYYSPELCRFISPDDVEYLNPQTVNGLNLYCYCYNNPINYIDPSGHIAFWLACGLVLGAIGLIGGGTYAGIKSYEAGNTGWDLVGDIALGAVVGGAAGFAAGALLGAGASILLTGSAGSAVGVVFNGAKGLAWAYSLGGPGAALGYCMNNIYSWWYGSSMLGYFPSGNGFSGPTQNITLQPGTIIQRFGGTGSNFVAPYYTDPFSLSLPYYQLPNMYNPNLYVVNQPINVIAGQAAPWFGQYGGGTQYVLPEIIRQLLESGAISPF